MVGASLMLSVVAKAADMRIWTAVNGQTLEAKFIQMSGPKVVLEKPDGKRIMIAKDNLCMADHEYLAVAIPPELKFEVDRDKDSQKTAQGYSYTFRRETVTLAVTIKKVNRDECSRKFKAKLYMLAESKGGDSSYMVMEHKEHSFDFIRGNNTHFDASSTVKNYEGYSYSRGWEYDGYVIVVEDEEGQIVATDASKSTFLSKIRTIENNRGNTNGFRL